MKKEKKLYIKLHLAPTRGRNRSLKQDRPTEKVKKVIIIIIIHHSNKIISGIIIRTAFKKRPFWVNDSGFIIRRVQSRVGGSGTGERAGVGRGGG